MAGINDCVCNRVDFQDDVLSKDVYYSRKPGYSTFTQNDFMVSLSYIKIVYTMKFFILKVVITGQSQEVE